MSAYRISGLFIYPIKGLGGIALSKSRALVRGFEHDRRWMLVDENDKFISQREHAELALFGCELSNEKLIVSYKNTEVSIGMHTYLEEAIEVEVWKDKFLAYEVNKESSEWFSEHLGMKVRLVKMTATSLRSKELKVAPHQTDLSFADGYPYLILGEASMAELNSRLAQPIRANRFRANIIVETTTAHEEDEWLDPFELGSAKMQVIKPCARCVVTTIDQQTAVKGKEPLKSLAAYRLWDNKIWFGANAICLHDGEIKVGDLLSL